MKKYIAVLFSVVLAISLLMIPVNAAGNQGQANGKPLIVSRLGIAQVQGQRVLVDVVVLVPQGQDPNEVALEALRQQGARPFESAGLGSAGFILTGLVWDSLSMVQNYNPGSAATEDEPASLGGNGLSALTATHDTWNEIPTSLFNITFGEITDRRPSLVRGGGPQYFDGLNDVAWMRLGGNTLGVTWYSTTIDEADMALNPKFAWANDGVSDFDAQAVFLHENGHVVGLGHSDDINAVMYPYYQGVDRDLDTDDIEGATYLYDSNITGSVSGTVTDGADPVGGASVVLEGTLPLLQAVTASDGTYTISNIPDPVTYTITASKGGFESDTISRLWVNGTLLSVNLTLTAAGGNGGGQAPIVESVAPGSASPGDRLIVAVSGENFQNGATVDFGQRINVQEVTFVSASQLDVKIKVHPRAASGPRDVTVINPDGQSDTKAAGFTVN